MSKSKKKNTGSTISEQIQPTELIVLYSYEDHFSLPMVSAAVRKNACGAIIAPMKGVLGSRWRHQKPKDLKFLHRNCTQLFFSTPIIIFFAIDRKIK